MLIDLNLTKDTQNLERTLKRLSTFSLQKKVGMKALRAGISIWRKELKKRLPKVRGLLRRALKIQQDTISAARKQLIHESIESLAKSNKAAGSPLSRAEVIKQGSKGLRRSDQISMSLGVTGNARRYAHMVEFGGPNNPNPDGSWRRVISPSMMTQVRLAIARKLDQEMHNEFVKAAKARSSTPQ